MFSRLLGAAEKNDADVVVCGCREFVEKDGVAVHEGGWSPDDEFYPEERVEQFRRGSAWCRCVGPVYNKLVRRSLVEEHSLRFVVGLKEGEDLAFLLMLLPFAPRLRTLSDRFTITAGNVPAPPRMDGTCCWATSAWTCWAWTGWPVSGSGTACWIPPAVFGLVDYYMEFIRRHFIMKEGAFFKASPEDRETLLSGWKKWLELVGGEKALSRLDRWDQAFCRLLLDYPLQGNFFSSLRARLMSSRKGRRGLIIP